MRDPSAIHGLMRRVEEFLENEFDEPFEVHGWSGRRPFTDYTGSFVVVEKNFPVSNPFSDVTFKWEERADYVWDHFDRAMRSLTRKYRRVLFIRSISLLGGSKHNESHN